MTDFDVIVVGGGGAGLAAAVSASRLGARTLIAEVGDRLGGSTVLSGGVLYAAGTSVQRAAGIHDDAADMFRYYMNLNQYRLDPGLIHRLCSNAAGTVEWLQGFGVEFPTDRLYVAGPDGVRRGHRAVGRGEAIVAALEGAISKLDQVNVVTRTRVTGLLKQQNTVVGVIADDTAISAPAVVLCSGGFGANLELVSRYLPDTARYGDWVWYVGSPLCRGDGLQMALDAGAEITSRQSVTTLLTPGFGRDFEPYIPGWFLFVSREGKRFVDETIDYSVSGSIVRELPGGECFAIFDEAARSGKEVRRAKGGELMTSPSWSPDRLAEMAKRGQIVQAQSLEALGTTVGINVPRLLSTVSNYNADCDRGRDEHFFKNADLLRSVREPPFYAVRIRPAVIGITGVGITINPCAEVLGYSGQSIAGLYAAGETVGGIIGDCYAAGGASLSNAFTFGRLAGEAAAEFAMASTGKAQERIAN